MGHAYRRALSGPLPKFELPFSLGGLQRAGVLQVRWSPPVRWSPWLRLFVEKRCSSPPRADATRGGNCFHWLGFRFHGSGWPGIGTRINPIDCCSLPAAGPHRSGALQARSSTREDTFSVSKKGGAMNHLFTSTSGSKSKVQIKIRKRKKARRRKRKKGTAKNTLPPSPPSPLLSPRRCSTPARSERRAATAASSTAS